MGLFHELRFRVKKLFDDNENKVSPSDARRVQLVLNIDYTSVITSRWSDERCSEDKKILNNNSYG